MAHHYRVIELDSVDLEDEIRDMISVRTSACEERNGAKSKEEQNREAEKWAREISRWRNPGIFLARRRKMIVGYLLGYQTDKGGFHIWHMGVRENLKRHGIGSSLLRRCEGHCRSRGYPDLRTNTYNRFKEKLILLIKEGFSIEGVTWVKGGYLRILFRKVSMGG